MAKIWSTIVTFMILFVVDQWIMTTTGHSPTDILSLAKNKSEVPIFALSLGSLLMVVSCALMLGLTPRGRSDSWVERVPALWVDPTEDERFRRVWKGTTLLMVLVFPLIAQWHFWRKFHQWKAWVNDGSESLNLVSLYAPVSPKYIFDWDAHRYGDASKVGQADWSGVSYLPLWQPILMATLSTVSLVLVLVILRRVFVR